MRRFLIVAAAAATAALPAIAAPDTNNRHDPERVVCKSMPVTGTRLSRERVCMTRRQWDQAAQEAQARHNDSMEQSGRINAGRGD